MPSSSGRRASESIPHRNALSVLPEPVGAQISVLAPLAICGQPAAWAGVGASKDASNQALVRSLKPSRGVDVAVESAVIRTDRVYGPATPEGGMQGAIVSR